MFKQTQAQLREECREGEGALKASTSSPHSNWLPVRDQTAQAVNYSNYDSLLAGINSIKRRLNRAH